MSTTNQSLTLAQATQAFTDWETDYRANPDGFYTKEETAAMEVASVSEARAIHFMALLRQRQAAASPAVVWLPLPGQFWPEQGGIYVGIAAAEGNMPAGHIVLLADKPATRLPWAQAVEWGKNLGNGAHVPTRFESALLYANVRDKLDINSWHWISTEHTNASSAWSCIFFSGSQLLDHKSYDGCAVAVRRLDLYSLNPLVGGAA